MSEKDDEGSSRGGEVDLDFEWDDALADWEDEVEDATAEVPVPKAPPVPKEATPAPARPLYRPPSPDEQFAQRKPVTRAPAPPARKEPIPLFDDDDDDDDASASTRITSVPQELIRSLVAQAERGNDHPTSPPPPNVPAAPRGPAVALDFDGLLEGMESDTRSYGEALPSPAAAETLREVITTRSPSGTPLPNIGGAAEAAKTPAPERASASDDDDVVASFRPPPNDLAPSGVAKAPKVPNFGADTPETPDEADELDVLDEVEDVDESPSPVRSAPPPPLPASSGVAPGAIGRPRVPPPRVPVPPPRPPAPAAGAKPAVPRPGLPPVPRPPLPRPGVPKPGAPEASVPRPPLPAVPRPGAKPLVPPPSVAKPVAVPPPGGAVAGPTRVADDERAPGARVRDERSGQIDKRVAEAAPEVKAAAPAEPDRREKLEPGREDVRGAATSSHSAEAGRASAPTAAPRGEREQDERPLGEPESGERDSTALSTDTNGRVDLEDGDRDSTALSTGANGRNDLERPATTDAGGDGELHVEDDAGDDGELHVEDGDDDEDWDAIEAAEADVKATEDRGALAARRSVRSRKPRDEVFPMIGDGPEALRLRKRLLETLAGTRKGGTRARLLVGAAEIAEQLGDADGARTLYETALDADPTDVVALRALRRSAMARGAWEELAALFAKEAELPLSPRERALALIGLAEVQLARFGDAPSAERAAARAVELEPGSIAARLLLAQARFAQHRADDALDALGPAAEHWDDAGARAAILVEQARRAEGAGRTEEARELYGAAAALDDDALDALFGIARTSIGEDGDARSAVTALAKIAARLTGPLREAVLTRASRIATRVLGDAQTGVSLLSDATGIFARQARAEAAVATGDRELARSALAAWAAAAGGTDRALALVRLAEVHAADGDLDAADAALRDAALADGSLGTIRVVREVIARRAGDVSRLDAIEAGGALGAAARVARSPGSLERERELLESAATEGQALVAVDVLTLDVAAARRDSGALDAALRRQAERLPPSQRTGTLLALADRAMERADLDAAHAALSEARTLAPGDPLVLRPLGRLAIHRDATATAALWMEESSVGAGERAAYAATEAGRVLARVDGDAVGALRRALDASRGYLPAAGLLKPLATDLGDPLTLLETHEQLADTAASPFDAAGHLVRAALLRAHDDPDGAGMLLERARQAVPADAVLKSLLMRLAGTTAPADRAAMLAESAESAPPVLARVFRLQAAAAYEDADDPVAAAALYRIVAKDHPDDPLVRLGLDRAEMAAGEIARVAERRFQAVKEAETEERRVLALERLADFDLHERHDPASAVLSLQSILETSPGHLPSLRALQRYFAEQRRTEDELDVVEKLAAHLEPGADVTAHLRLARRLRLASADAPGHAADELLARHAPRAEFDLWLAPRVLAAAEARKDGALAALAARRLAELLAGTNERATARVRAAEFARAAGVDGALELLREAVQSAPLHPFAAAALAEVCELEERWEEAADAWEEAAKASEVRTRAAALFYRAGRIREERLGDRERARHAYERAAERDVTYGDLFERLRAVLEAANDRERLAELFGQRIAAGADTPALVDLYTKQAALYSELRNLASAKSALRAALALAPERLDALRTLANLCLEDEDWRGAAEALIRIARIRKEREELRWVFFTLGDIYDRHMPDARRAEAAFQRVLKLLPDDVPAMERLAALYEREGAPAKAAEMLVELARLDVDPERNRAHRLRLAAMYEQLGDARRAEQVLEEARRNAPTDLAVLRALADFYRRQSAANALAMHLGRAINDFRHALEADLGDAAAWPGLVEVLTWRGDSDAASAAASAAQAIGIVDVETSKLVDARGAAPGLGAGAAGSTLDDLLAPAELSAPAREVFRVAGEALEKSLPFDVAAYRAEKLSPRDTVIRPIALEVARWFGIADPQLYITSAAPRVCVPVYGNPVTLLIGSELLGITDDREKLFMLVRAFKIAEAQLSVVVRAQPAEVVALLGGLVALYDPRHLAPGADPALVAEASRRIAKTLPKKVQAELGPLVFEMAGRPGYDPARFAMAASEWGNRAALVASGSAPAAVAALAKLSGERELPPDPSARLAMLQRFPEAASLLAFAVSDAHFEARRRAARR